MKQLFFVFLIGVAALPTLANSSLTIYAYPPSHPLDWSTPRSLLKTIMATTFEHAIHSNDNIKFVSDFGDRGSISSEYRSSMGHTIAHVKCTLSSGETYDRWASFSGQDYIEQDKKNFFQDKLGFGALFYDFVDGHIIAGVENVKRITYYQGVVKDGDGREQKVDPRFMKIRVSPRSCDDLREMIRFFESFHFKPGTPLAELKKRSLDETLYFNTMDPYSTYVDRIASGHGAVGGGCAPFGAALVKISRNYDEAFEHLWRRPLRVSEKMIGGTRDENGEIRRISVHELLFGDLATRWEVPGVPSRQVTLYDPAMIWHFIGEVRSCVARGNCEAGAKAWFKTQSRGRVRLGPTQKFSGTHKVKFPGNEEPPQWDVRTTERSVEGIEWDGP